MTTQISTLNVCLGLKNNKCLVKNILEEQKIDVLSMQEIELDNSRDPKVLELPNFSLEIEKKNSHKSGVGSYISKRVNYKRKEALEE